MQVLHRNLMEAAYHATLEQAPEILDAVGMDVAANILFGAVPD